VTRYVGNRSTDAVDPTGLKTPPPRPPVKPPAKPKPLSGPVTIKPGMYQVGDVVLLNDTTWIVVGADGLYHVYTNGVSYVPRVAP